MKRNMAAIVVLLLLMILFGIGCAADKTQKDIDSKATTEVLGENEYRIYCLNKAETKLSYNVYAAQSETPEELAYELLAQMSADTESLDWQNVIEKPVEVQNVMFAANRMYVHFNEEYYNIDSVKEVLVRAAIVRTLTQIDTVDAVAFYVGGEMQKTKNGVVVGAMRATDFIDDTGGDINDYKKITIVLYFTDEQGTKLYKENREVFVDEMSSREKVVLEQLISGPEQENLSKVLPDGVTLISVVTKEDTCYVNLNDTFLTGSINVVETIPIYAIVNSLTELGSVNKVQILIKGETGKVYREIIRLDSPLERREDLIAGSE